MTTLQTKCILIYLLYLKKTKYALLDLMIKKLYLSVTLSLSLSVCLEFPSLGQWYNYYKMIWYVVKKNEENFDYNRKRTSK
jgi:hypothetical protein